MLKWFLFLICIVLAIALYFRVQKLDEVKSELHSTQTELQTAQTQVAQLTRKLQQMQTGQTQTRPRTRQLQQLKTPPRAASKSGLHPLNPFPNSPLNQPAH